MLEQVIAVQVQTLGEHFGDVAGALGVEHLRCFNACRRFLGPLGVLVCERVEAHGPVQGVCVAHIEPGIGRRINMREVIVFCNVPGAGVDPINIDLPVAGDFHIQRMAFLDQGFARKIGFYEVVVGMEKFELAIFEIFPILRW